MAFTSTPSEAAAEEHAAATMCRGGGGTTDRSRPACRRRAETPSVVGPSFDAVAEIIGGVSGALETPIAVYAAEQDRIKATIGYVYGGDPREGIELVRLPAAGQAFATVHLGEIHGIRASWQALHEEIIARGYEPTGPCRELYLRTDESGRTHEFVVELQQPVQQAEGS